MPHLTQISRRLLLAITALGAGVPSLFGAFATQFIGPDGGNWNVPSNWSAGVPDINDEISLGGFNVIVTDTQAYKDFDFGAGATGGGLTIQSGGNLTTNGDFHGAYGLNNGITIESGGTFTNVSSSTAAQLRSSTTIDAGGMMQGFNSIRATLNVNGEWRPYNSTDPNSTVVDSTVNLNAGGTIELDIFGSNSSESFNVQDGRTLNLNIVGSSLELVPQGGYIPTGGDSFDLWDTDDTNGTGVVNVLGDASNVTIQGFPVVWDASQWESDGILTVVPEPSTYALIAGVLALGVMVYRRHNGSKH